MHSTASFARGKGQPDRDIYNLLATLNQEQLREKHDINGLYEGRLRSHAQRFEDLKRTWEGFTGVPAPKKLRTSESIHNELVVAKANEVTLVQNIQTSVIEEEEEQQIMIPPTDPMVITASSAEQTTSAAPSPPTMPPHPDDKINIDNMIVSDLRKELKKRQLATAGRKAELQDRLREYLAEATLQREMEWASKFATEVAAEDKTVQKKQVQISESNCGDCNEDVNAMDVVMADDEGADNMEEIKSAVVVNKEEVNPMPVVRMEPVMDQVAQPSSSHPAVMAKKQAPKSALKPSKYPSSVIESTTQLADITPAPEPVVTKSFVSEPSPCPKQLIPNKVSNSSTESSTSSSAVPNSTFKKSVLQSSASKSTAPSSFLHKSPGPSAYRSGGGAESTKLLQKKQAISEAAEARKARMAEMRQKSKPAVAGATSTIEPPPSNSKYAMPSSMKKMAPIKENKQNTVVAKMREKVAAEKNSERADPALPTRPSQTVESIRSMSSSSTIATTLVPQIPTASSQYASKPHPSALTSIIDPANKPTASPKKIVPEKQSSPIQTYVMSDREESDSEDESDEEEDDRHKPKKSIPLWAQKTNLHRALERQFADGPNRLDPDKIFGEVLTCNLEEIFDKKKSRYQRRTSSGNWTKDHVTAAEKLTYKRTMGYDKR